MLKRLVLIALLLLSVRAQALEFTDVYYNPNESGWGVFLVQSDTTQFLAFFIYGPDGKPTWYVAILADDGTGNYTGSLFATTGTYFAAPWQGDVVNTVGTVSFQPTDSYHATLTYTVNGVGTVTKTVQRQTLTPYVLAGNYSGSAVGAISGCANAAQNVPLFTNRFNLAVTQVDDTSATLTFTVVDANNVVCTISGPLTHFGRLYQIANASYSCPLTPVTPIQTTVNNLHPTGHGIEGHVKSNLGSGCVQSLHFSGVNLTP